MATQAQLQEMLGLDKSTYQNLALAFTILGEGNKRLAAFNAGDRTYFKTATDAKNYGTKLLANLAELRKIRATYEARQNDYRTNTAYNLANSLSEAADEVTMFCKNLFIKSKNSGLGEPISITTVILISAVSVAIITYFVTKYYNDTVNGYNSTLKLIQDINKDNPELASQLANQVADVQKNKDDSSFMSQLGTGLKWAAGLIGFGGLLYLGSKSYDSYKKHKK